MFGFVRRSKYDELLLVAASFRDQRNEYKMKYNLALAKIGDLYKELTFYAKKHEAPKQFTQAELKTLIRLCHPDKHGGNDEAATAITQKLIRLRGVICSSSL